MSGCSGYRELYIECAAGQGVNEDYYLEYLVYLDFGKPSIEKTKIVTFFELKENAYAFAKKYQPLVVNGFGDVHITQKENGYQIEINRFEKAKFNTFSEYVEKVNVLNKKEKVCTISR